MEATNRVNDEIEISLTDVLLSIWDLRWIVVVLALMGGIVGTIFSTGQKVDYRAEASMIVTARNAGGTYQNGAESPRAEEIYLSQNLTKTVRLLAASDRVLDQVLQEYNEMCLWQETQASGETQTQTSKETQMPGAARIRPEDLRERIVVKAEDNTSFLRLTLSWENQEEAVEIVNRIMEVLPEVMLEVMDIGSVSVIDLAKKADPVRVSSPKYIGVGAGLGLVMGCFLGILYYLFVPKVRGKSSLEALELDIIAEIPKTPKKGETGSCYLDEGELPQEYREAFGRMAVVFGYLTEQKAKKIIAVTSSVSGEGKSTVAYNLALRLTEAGRRILLLDFDFKKGILYQLARDKKPKDGDVRTESRNRENLKDFIEVMFNGIYTIQGFAAKDIFRAENKVFAGLRQLKDEFDYILIDTPPVGILSDVQQMRELIEGVLLVVREDAVPVEHVAKSVDFLKQSGIEVVGCVLNGGKLPAQVRKPGNKKS